MIKIGALLTIEIQVFILSIAEFTAILTPEQSSSGISMNNGLSNHQQSMTLTWNRAAKDVRNCLSGDRLNYYRLLAAVIAQIRSSLNLDIILNTTVKEVRHLLDTDRVAIFQFHPDQNSAGEVVCEDVRFPWQPATAIQVQDHCFGEQFADQYLKGRISAIADIYDTHISDCHRQILAQFQVRSNLVAPLVKELQLWGLLCIHQCSEPREWNLIEIEFVNQISQQIGVAIQQSELLKKTEYQAQELKQTLQQLRQTQSQMIQNEKMVSLGHLVAGVAHEINNPVSFIQGNITYVEEYTKTLLRVLQDYQEAYPNPVDQVQQSLEENDVKFIQQDLPKILRSMQVGVTRIQGIVSSLRTFSRLDEAQVKVVDIHEGIESTLVILNHRLKGKGDRPAIKILKHYGNLPLIPCYPAQLNQVFMNLLSNAIDALESAQIPHPQLQIETQLENQKAIISIRDNGPGIPDSILSQIFDPFFTTKPPGKGTGLGLSISYQIIVEKHQGQLYCHSVMGQGTTFMIELKTNLKVE